MARLALAFISIALASTAVVAHADEEVSPSATAKSTKILQRQLNTLARDPALAEAKLGPGMRIVRLKDRNDINDYYDVESGRMRARVSPPTLKLTPHAFTLAPTPHLSQSPLQRIEVGLTLPAGDTSFAAKHLGLSSSTSLAKLTKTTVGSHAKLYAITKDGQHIGELELSNHYFKDASGKHGRSSSELTTYGEHAQQTSQALAKVLRLPKSSTQQKFTTGIKLLGAKR